MASGKSKSSSNPDGIPRTAGSKDSGNRSRMMESSWNGHWKTQHEKMGHRWDEQARVWIRTA